MGLAERRHHEQRMKRRFRSAYDILGPDWAKKNAGIYAHHGKTCSCPMCGNPRRHFGERTLQERRALDKRLASQGIYDGDADAPCPWHCTDDDPEASCEAI